MKLAIYAPYNLNFIGGVERFIRSFASCAARQHEVVLLTDHSIDLPNVKLAPLSSKQSNFDLLISHAIYGSHDHLSARVKLHTFHGTILGNLRVRPWLWIHPKFWRWLKMEMDSLSNKSGVIAVSDWANSEVRKMGFQGPIRQIPSAGGMQEDAFKFASRLNFEKDDTLRLLFCGRRYDKVKRFSMIREGFQIALKRSERPIELHVFGGEREEGNPGEFFHGTVPFEIALSRLGEFDCQINASYYEGYSLSLSEGVYQGGLITLATPRGGNLHCLEDGVTGYFFKNAKQLGQILLNLASSTDSIKRLKNNIRESHPIQSWESVVQSSIQFAQELM